jgi:hypothetical protein
MACITATNVSPPDSSPMPLTNGWTAARKPSSEDLQLGFFNLDQKSCRNNDSAYRSTDSGESARPQFSQQLRSRFIWRS